MTQKRSKHGGYRPGAGRPKGEPTQRITVPAAQVLDIQRFLERKDMPQGAGKRLVPAANAPVIYRFGATRHRNARCLPLENNP